MWWAAGVIVLSCVAAALLTRRLQATATLPITFTVGGVVLLAGAVGAGSRGSLLLVLALFALAWLLGEMLLLQLPATPTTPLARLPISTGLGLGLFGLMLLLLATLNALNTATVTRATGGNPVRIAAAISSATASMRLRDSPSATPHTNL